MSFINKIAKLGDIIKAPLEFLADWGREPLRNWEHQRTGSTSAASHQRELERIELVARNESEARIREAEHQATLPQKLARAEAELAEWRKDQDLQRMTVVSDAIMRYTKELSALNLAAVEAIGQMQVDLTQKAQALLSEKSQEYKKIQDGAFEALIADMTRIETTFQGNDTVKAILIAAAEKKFASTLEACTLFVHDLNEQINRIHENINSLTQTGQDFINTHLKSFHVLGTPITEAIAHNEKNSLPG